MPSYSECFQKSFEAVKELGERIDEEHYHHFIIDRKQIVLKFVKRKNCGCCHDDWTSITLSFEEFEKAMEDKESFLENDERTNLEWEDDPRF